eukprot:6560448-Karenia_brevis.AAC.1
MHYEKLSDHACVSVSLAKKQSKPCDERPIPSFIFKDPKYPVYLQRLERAHDFSELNAGERC